MAVDEHYARALRDLIEADRQRIRLGYVLKLLVAGGHVTQEKVDEAFSIADGVQGDVK